VSWTPRFTPEDWVYTICSNIKEQDHLGAAVVHIPSRTKLYIDANDCDETRTIMRTELVILYTALSTCEAHPWLGIFTDSLSSVQAIRLHYYKPGHTASPHYHQHMLLLESNSQLLESRQ